VKTSPTLGTCCGFCRLVLGIQQEGIMVGLGEVKERDSELDGCLEVEVQSFRVKVLGQDFL
jgi:hypothetical protein